MFRTFSKPSCLISILFYLIISTSLISCFKPPVIAMLANPDPYDTIVTDKSYINYQYVRWLEQSRADVIVIHPWYNTTVIDEILSKANGVLWAGGDRNLNLSADFENVALHIMKRIIYLYDVEKISLPLWATCQGFELLQVLLAKNLSVLTHFSAQAITSPLRTISNAAQDSKMFSGFSEQDLYNLNNLNVTAQFHQLGVHQLQFKIHQVLNETLKITSYGVDKNGLEYIATLEGRKYPFYAVQFHPEMVAYTKIERKGVPQSLEAIKISQLFSNFFIGEAMKNNNTMSYDDMIRFDYLDAYQKIPTYQDGWHYYYFVKDVKGYTLHTKKFLNYL